MNALGSDRTPRRWVYRGGLVLVLALAVGCGGQTARVSGQVLYKNKPVTGGLLTFTPTDTAKRSVPAPIDANGRYEVTLPIGEVKIAVDNRELEPAPQNSGGLGVPLPPGVKLPPVEKKGGAAVENPAAAKRPPGTYVAIPPDYYDVQTSKLTYTVRPGSQTHDIDLK
jgi:hypothetical protein